MSVIVVDAAFKAKLLAAGGAAELRDESGALVARVTAEPAREEQWNRKRLAEEMELPEEELARRLAPDAVTYTTEEVLAYCKGRRK